MTNHQHGQVPEALTHERDRAIMEGERNASLDAYSRVVLLTSAESRLYEAAFTNGWDRCATHVQNPADTNTASGAADSDDALMARELYESQDDSLLLCASDLQHGAIYDNHAEMQSCMRAVAVRITALASAPAQPVAEPAGATSNTHWNQALRLADELEIPIEGYPEATELERNAAAELRRLHAYCQELEAQVIRDCMTHGQKPAESEHVAGDVSKNSAKKNMNDYAELPEPDATTVGLGAVWNRHSMRDFADATHALRTQQTAPATQQAAGNSGFDHKTAADFLSGKTVSDEALRKFVAASRGAHDDRAVLRAQMLALRGVLASREAEIALLKRSLLDAEAAAPQPSQAATAESALEDAARLDFLIEQRAYVVSDPDTCPGYWLHFVHKETGKCWVQADEHPTPRAAIDAARKQGGA